MIFNRTKLNSRKTELTLQRLAQANSSKTLSGQSSTELRPITLFGERMKNPATQAALDFVHHLASSRFDQAHLLLSKEAMAEYSAADLEESFSSLAEYDGGKLTEIEAMDGLEDWPAKKSGDICTFYISISGRSAKNEGWICEAVAGVLAMEAGTIRIHSLEWGRP